MKERNRAKPAEMKMEGWNKIISDICLNNAIGPCKYVMDQTFRDSEGRHWTEEYCILTGWRLFGSVCKADCSRESCTYYQVQIGTTKMVCR